MQNNLQNHLILEMPRLDDYELQDSGNGQKLEKFGQFKFVRPESQALWSKRLPQSEWSKADAIFHVGNEKEKSRWQFKREIPKFTVEYDKLKFYAEPTPFRHLGIFPEQSAHFEWMKKLLEKKPSAKILNLFGYTGFASLFASKCGAEVTHVDASKKSIEWAKENQKLSGLPNEIRWIEDDALQFVKREARRGKQYDSIILDPPKFGRGPKGEIWKIEEKLPELLCACKEILSPSPLFVLMTVYATDFSPLSLNNLMSEIMQNSGKTESGELIIPEISAGRLLPVAIFCRWSA